MTKVTRVRNTKSARIQSPFHRCSVASLHPRDLLVKHTAVPRDSSTPAEASICALFSAEGSAHIGGSGLGADVPIVLKARVEVAAVSNSWISFSLSC